MYGTAGRVARTQQTLASRCWARLLYGTRSHYEGREQQDLAAAHSQGRARGPGAKHLSEDNVDALLDQNRFPNNTDHDHGRGRGLDLDGDGDGPDLGPGPGHTPTQASLTVEREDKESVDPLDDILTVEWVSRTAVYTYHRQDKCQACRGHQQT